MNTKNYELTNLDGKATAVTESEFNEALSSGKYHRYDIDNTSTLFPYSENTTNYGIDFGNGTSRSFNRKVFFALLTAQRTWKKHCEKHGLPFVPQFCHAEYSDKCHALMPPTAANIKITKDINDARKVEANDISRENRCYDHANNRVCRYQHGADGKRSQHFKNGRWYDKVSNCSNCPRNGNIGGDIFNCCLWQTCTADCERCPLPKQCAAPLSTAGRDTPDKTDFTKILEDKALLELLFNSLKSDEQSFFTAVFDDEDYSINEYAQKLQKLESNTPLKTIVQRLNRLRLHIRDEWKRLNK